MTAAEEQIRAALAAGPTPGPWKACRSYECFDGHLWDIDPEDLADFECRPFVRIEAAGSNIASAHDLFEFKTADARLIAACNPAALAELLAELDRLRAERKPLTDDELARLEDGCWSGLGLGARFDRKAYARAVERAHGITGD